MRYRVEPHVWPKLLKLNAGQHLAVCWGRVWVGCRAAAGGTALPCHPWRSPPSECPSVLLLKGAWGKQLRRTTLEKMKTLSPHPPRNFSLAKYSAFCENEYFLSWRAGVRCHSGEGFLHCFFSACFQLAFLERSSFFVLLQVKVRRAGISGLHQAENFPDTGIPWSYWNMPCALLCKESLSSHCFRWGIFSQVFPASRFVFLNRAQRLRLSLIWCYRYTKIICFRCLQPERCDRPSHEYC